MKPKPRCLATAESRHTAILLRLSLYGVGLLLLSCASPSTEGPVAPRTDYPATPTPQPTPEPGADVRDIAALCVTETNQYRSRQGKAAVQANPRLAAYATEGAAYDFTRGAHAHFRATRGGGIAFAENECPRWALAHNGGSLAELTRRCLKAFFDEGPGGGHYDNMMGNYRTVGCGWFERNGEVTLVQNFGR